MKNLLVILVFMAFVGVCHGDDLIGQTVPPYPPGVSVSSAACISGSLGSDRICDFSLAIIETGKGLHIYLGKSVPSTNPKEPKWIVLDQRAYPETQKDERIVFAVCEVNSIPDESIIAVVKEADLEWFSDVKKAFKANFISGKIEPISTKSIQCINEGWGV